MLNASTFRDIVSGRRRDLIAIASRCLLAIAEVPYRLVVGMRNRRFDRDASLTHRVDAPVICVGNLTLGGTGKTPVVAWLARWFRDRDVRVSIISRGYGSKGGGRNDEARELESRLPDVPHLQNPDRVAAASVAINELETQLILLDDGFQHRRIHRDLNVLLIDATEPFGFDHVFPRGTLREPLQSAIRAHVVALTKCETVASKRLDEIESRYRNITPSAIFVRLQQRPKQLVTSGGDVRPIELLHGKRVVSFCAIGNPAAFRTTVETCGCELVAFREFPDHHEYTRSDVESIGEWARHDQPDLIVCTHKDLVKLNVDRIAGVRLYALQIELDALDGMEELEQRLQMIVDGL